MTDASPTSSEKALVPYRSLRFALWFVAGLGLVCLLPYWAGIGLSDIARGIASVPTVVFPLLIAAQMLIVLAGARKWQIVLRSLPGNPVSLPFGLCSTATTLGALIGQVLPIQVVTPAVRGWLARRYRVSVLRSVGGSIYEQTIDFLVLAAASSASVMLWMLGTGTALAVALAVMTALTLAMRPMLSGLARVVAFAARRGVASMAKVSAGLTEAAGLPVHALRTLVSLGLLRYLLLAAINVGTICLLEPRVDPLLLLSAYPVILLVMSAPVFPGGLGVTEMTWTAFLVAAGSTTPDAVEAALVLRILSTAAFLIAVPALLGFGMAASQKGRS